MTAITSFPPKMNQHMMDVMTSMGWDEKAFVPIANETNRKLMAEIRLLQEEKAKKASLQELLKERVTWLKQHVDHCHSDIARNLVCCLIIKMSNALHLSMCPRDIRIALPIDPQGHEGYTLRPHRPSSPSNF